MGKTNKQTPNDSDVTYSVNDLYSANELQKLMELNTKAGFREIGIKLDKTVFYYRMFLYVVLNAIGGYTTFFVHVEKSKFLLKLSLTLFFSTLLVYVLYDKVYLRCSQFRVVFKVIWRIILAQRSKFLVWSRVNKMDGTFEITYKKCGSKGRRHMHKMQLCDVFYEDGVCDYGAFLKSLDKLKTKLITLDNKR